MPFKRELLPPPSVFFARELKRMSRPSRGWARALCPFHRDHNPSFVVNLTTGGFFCFACQAKGGDILAFVMLRDKLDFQAAAREVGAWCDSATAGVADRESAELVKRKRVRERIDAAADALWNAEHRLRMGYRDTIYAMERVIREMQTRLQLTSEDYDTCGHVLSMALDELREASAAYHILSFGTVGERAVLNSDRRSAAIQKVLLSGSVRTDSGHVMEVVFP